MCESVYIMYIVHVLHMHTGLTLYHGKISKKCDLFFMINICP